MASKRTKEKRRESHSGFHFYNLYQNCPRKFFIKYVLRILPKKTARALIFGAAFHEAKRVFYNTKSLKRALSTGEHEILDRKDEYIEGDVADEDIWRLETLFKSWAEQNGFRDLETFKRIVEVEKQSKIQLYYAPEYIVTVRPDAVFEMHDESLLILETKTTSFSYKSMALDVALGDQSTTYTRAVAQRYPDKRIAGVLPDISFWYKNSSNPDRIVHHRPEIIVRTKRDLQEWDQGTSGILVDISNRVDALNKGEHPAGMLFPRNTAWCNSFSKPCEYAEICRQKLSGKGRAPNGFRRDKRSRFKLTDPVGYEE
jgi:hypothetical protein